MIQNPGRVLCYTFMVWLLSQVMDNAIVNVGNLNAVNTVDAKTREKAANAVDAETKENMVNEDNPEQGLPSQVGELNIDDKDHEDEDVIYTDSDMIVDHGNVGIAVDNENMNMVSLNEDKSEQVSTSQVAGVANMDEVHVDMKVSEDKPDQALSRQVVEMDIGNKDHGHVDIIDSDSDVIVVGSGPTPTPMLMVSTMRTTWMRLRS
jgi:hypothetical protein